MDYLYLQYLVQFSLDPCHSNSVACDTSTLSNLCTGGYSIDAGRQCCNKATQRTKDPIAGTRIINSPPVPHIQEPKIPITLGVSLTAYSLPLGVSLTVVLATCEGLSDLRRYSCQVELPNYSLEFGADVKCNYLMLVNNRLIGEPTAHLIYLDPAWKNIARRYLLNDDLSSVSREPRTKVRKSKIS